MWTRSVFLDSGKNSFVLGGVRVDIVSPRKYFFLRLEHCICSGKNKIYPFVCGISVDLSSTPMITMLYNDEFLSSESVIGFKGGGIGVEM